MDVNERDTGSQEERAVNVRRIHQLADVLLQFLGVLELPLDVLLLEESVEAGNYMPVNLSGSVSC